MKGLLLVGKPLDYTSHDAVDIVRELQGVYKAGHIGTLDPTATGLLGVLLNKATKISQFLVGLDKRYRIEAKFGRQTDTLDQAGETVDTCNTDHITKEEIRKTLSEFEGKTEQKPPKYSAIKKEGKKLYEYAREEKEIDIPTRTITIKTINLEEFDPEEKVMHLNIKCSSGTYTRSLARDIAYELDSCAYQTGLERYEINDFSLNQAVALSKIKDKDEIESLDKNILSVNEVLDSFPKIVLKENAVKFAKNGTQLRPKNFVDQPDLSAGTKVRVCSNQENILAVGKILKNPIDSNQAEEVLGYETVLS